MKSVYKKILTSCTFLFLGAMQAVAQMPDCLGSGGFVYIHAGNSIHNWDPTQPISATNPVLNTINNPGGGLAVSDLLGVPPGMTYRTFYTTIGNNYWYYDGTAWVNTGHSVGNGAAVNLGGGGGFIYNLVGGSGQVYSYDGTGNGALLTTVVGFNGGGPYDLVADRDGNWYILKLTNPQYLRKYDPTGVLLKEWVISGAPTGSAGGGFAIVCNDLYYHNGFLGRGRIETDTIFVTQIPGAIPSPADFGSCELGVASATGGSDTSFYLYRGCLSGKVDFNRVADTTETKFKLKISGNAINGSDYTYIDSTLIIPRNGTTASIIVEPLLRNPSVGDKSLKIEVIGSNPCLGGGDDMVIRTIDVLIKDSLEVAIISPPVTVCPNDDVVIQATKDPTLDHVWNPSAFIPAGSGLVVTVNPTMTTRYSITVTQPGAPATCPPRTKHYTATVEPYPVVDVQADFTVCLTDSIELEASVGPEGKYNFAWSPASNFGNPNVITPKFFAQPGIYKKVLSVTTLVAKCLGKDSVTITVVPPFEFSGISQDTIIDYGQSVQLNVDGGAKYWIWSPTSRLNDPNFKSPLAAPLEDTRYTVIGIDQYGCRDTAFVNVGVKHDPKIIVPNAFTPNNDGLNDRFGIVGLTHERFISMEIFDKWGKLVYHTETINHEWDGTYGNGKPADNGVYFYVIKINDPLKEMKIYKGDVTLLR